MADEMADEMVAQTEPETETPAPEHEIGAPRCAVCGKDTWQPISLRQWDDELDEALEAEVCSGDCAKAWIDGDLPDDDADEPDGTIVIPSYADEAGVTHPGWARDVEIAPGQSITYTAHAATDPTTVAALDELARAAYAQFAPAHTAEPIAEPIAAQSTAPEEAWQFEMSSNGGAMGTLTVERESGRWASTVNAQTSTVWLESRAYDATFTGLDGSTWRTIITATDLAWLRRAAKRQAERDAEQEAQG